MLPQDEIHDDIYKVAPHEMVIEHQRRMLRQVKESVRRDLEQKYDGCLLAAWCCALSGSLLPLFFALFVKRSCVALPCLNVL